MKKYFVVFYLGFLVLNCAAVKAQNIVRSQDSLSSQSEDSLRIIGRASWYYNRGGLFAASTKFKKGSVLRVINPANNKYVDVTINDYGPNKRKYPNRIIDLDKFAFQKIAALKSGLIKIIIQPLQVF